MKWLRDNLKIIALCAFVSLLSGAIVALAQQTNYLGTVFIADYATPTQQLHVNADGSINVSGGSSGPVSVSSFDSGPVIATETPNGSSHAPGTVLGGLFSVALARTNGGSGIVTNFSWTSTGGSTGQVVIRIWDKNPSGAGCTDNAAYIGSGTADQNLITPPFSITPAAPAVTTGDSKTYASVAGVTWDYKNADTSPGQNLYLCAVTVGTDTQDESNALTAMLSGPQN